MEFIIHVSVLLTWEGRVAMVCEGKPQSRGKWNLPGGHLELGEGLVAGAKRELLEETGATPSLDGFLGVYTGLGEHHFLNLVFTADTDDSCLKCSASDVMEAKWFSVPELLAMPDGHVLNPRKLGRILQDWQTREPYGLECIGELMYGDRPGAGNPPP